MGVEIKDKTKPVVKFYGWIDKYLKFMTLQRGKGAFYLGVGLLVVFMSPTTSVLGVNNVAAIFLAVVGFLHTFRIIRETAVITDPAGGMAPASDGLEGDFSQPINASGTRSSAATWNTST